MDLLEEFFDFACPASSLGVFLDMCNDETLLHPFCDLRFSRFLQEYYQGGKVMYLDSQLIGVECCQTLARERW